MPLDPQVQKFLDEMASAGGLPIEQLPPADARRQMAAGTTDLGKSEAVEKVIKRRIPGAEGEVRVRIYHPGGASLPVVVYFHGGGWVLGSIATHDGYCRALANAAKAIVVSVDYRLAPEHPYPAAVHDAYAAVCWASQQMAELGARPGPIVVAGDSAGGNLAAAATLMARERGGPEIRYQVLVYPITDHDFETGSYRDFANGYFLTREAMRWFWNHYCPDATRRNDAFASPLRADDLGGLPPALVITAEFDPLRDEGEAYALRLREAGVEVTYRRYDGMIHGFSRRLNQFRQAKGALQEVAQAIADSH